MVRSGEHRSRLPLATLTSVTLGACPDRDAFGTVPARVPAKGARAWLLGFYLTLA